MNIRNETIDEFELPASILGPLPDWFYPALGRVVAVSALLENKAQVLAETLAHSPQDSLTMTSVAKLRKIAISAAIRIDSANAGSVQSTVDPISAPVSEFFDEVVRLLDRRNGVVHAIWPAQPGEQQFGWRPRRTHHDDETRLTDENTRDRLTDLIRRETDLILGFNNLHGSVTHARLRAAEGGYETLAIDG